MVSTVDRFYAIDFDRCLSDTPKLDEVFYSLVREYKNLDADLLLETRNAVEDKGGSVNMLTPLEDVLSPEQVASFVETFIDRSRVNGLLSLGASELLEALGKHRELFGIVSYGDDQWQSIKIKAAGLDKIPSLITDSKKKGEIIASWQQEDGTFSVPARLTADVPSNVVIAHGLNEVIELESL